MRFIFAALSLVPFHALSTSSAFAASATQQFHREFRAEAAAAYQRQDYAAAKAATLSALALQPDSPRYLHNLAALSALTGDPRTAAGYLRRLAALGVTTNIERDPDLASLQGQRTFRHQPG